MPGMNKELNEVKSKIFNLNLLQRYSKDDSRLFKMPEQCEVGFIFSETGHLSGTEKKNFDMILESAYEIASINNIHYFETYSEREIAERIRKNTRKMA
jgi:hypothetical protein